MRGTATCPVSQIWHRNPTLARLPPQFRNRTQARRNIIFTRMMAERGTGCVACRQAPEKDARTPNDPTGSQIMRQLSHLPMLPPVHQNRPRYTKAAFFSQVIAAPSHSFLNVCPANDTTILATRERDVIARAHAPERGTLRSLSRSSATATALPLRAGRQFRHGTLISTKLNCRLTATR